MNEAAGRLTFRALTNEQNTTVLSDSTGSIGAQCVDTYLQAGLLETSRQLGGYYLKSGTVTLVASTSEASLPADFVDVLWVRHAGLYLKRSTFEEWLSAKVNWTNTTAAVPREYAINGTQATFYPKPNADAVDDLANGDSTPDVFYVATPADYTGNGFLGLQTQDHFLPVYYAAALFIQLHNDVPEMQVRAKNLFELFYEGCKGARPFYERKRMPGRKVP